MNPVSETSGHKSTFSKTSTAIVSSTSEKTESSTIFPETSGYTSPFSYTGTAFVSPSSAATGASTPVSETSR